MVSNEDVGRARVAIENAMRGQGLSLEDAADEIGRLLGEAGRPTVDQAVDAIRESARRNQLLKVPAGVSALEYRAIVDEAKGIHWYSGPRQGGLNWQGLHDSMRSGGSLSDEAIDAIDMASTKIVAHLPDPGIPGLKKKGLVVGFVQSGKTANYAAVVAKAADAGYRLFIILSGIHNGLRQQTQLRLERDVIQPHPNPWVRLTQSEKDFGAVDHGSGLLSSRELRNLAVVKKNGSRLKNIREWLEAIPPEVRQRCPALIIDDEADQATPNTKAARDERSKINEHLVEIFKLLPTGAYVGYTATPFANVFLDPQDEADFYPSDFIVDLPRPSGYFGAEELFGSDEVGPDGDSDDGFDMIRRIPLPEAEAIRPPGHKREDRLGFDPAPPPSLLEALKWFVVATAARRARGQVAHHASMLVHTSPYVQQHDALAARLESMIQELQVNYGAALLAQLGDLWRRETDRVPPELFEQATMDFDSVSVHIEGVLRDLSVKSDHGQSPPERRVNFANGVQTVVVVGGNTLSRGLTLEGLTVTYFCRDVATYDTLLQMGRWFGFRPGYGDLPRIWVTEELERRFRFLADMERDMRHEIARYERENITPSQMGLRIRSHPDMAITAANKRRLARVVKFSYAGRRFQTFRFTRKDAGVLNGNLDATRTLLTTASEHSAPEQVERSRWVLRDVDRGLVETFLGNYQVHPDHKQLQREAVLNYLSDRDDDLAARWNVAVVGSAAATLRGGDNEEFDPGSVDLGLPKNVQMVNRAALKGSDEPADIKALMSRRDRFIDLGLSPADYRDLKTETDLEQLRRMKSDGRGLLLLYPISPNSRPTGAGARTGSRKPLDIDGEVDSVIGIGIIFPESPSRGTEPTDFEYVGLPFELFESDDFDEEEIALLAKDDEASATVDGNEFLAR